MSCLFSFIFLCFGIAVVLPCREYWLQFEGSCYGFGELLVTWEEAQEFCRSVGARLAEVETAAENDFLKSVARNKSGAYWLGASDVFHEGAWTWMSTGASLTFSDWMPGKPDDNKDGQDCLWLQKQSTNDYLWNDGTCAHLKEFICEARAEEAVIG